MMGSKAQLPVRTLCCRKTRFVCSVQNQTYKSVHIIQINSFDIGEIEQKVKNLHNHVNIIHRRNDDGKGIIEKKYYNVQK